MPVKDLREKYGNIKRTRSLLNKAIRAECAGADGVLSALDFAAQRCQTSKDWAEIYEILLSARGAMTAEIARRYDFKSEAETNEQNQTP